MNEYRIDDMGSKFSGVDTRNGNMVLSIDIPYLRTESLECGRHISNGPRGGNLDRLAAIAKFLGQLADGTTSPDSNTVTGDDAKVCENGENGFMLEEVEVLVNIVAADQGIWIFEGFTRVCTALGLGLNHVTCWRQPAVLARPTPYRGVTHGPLSILSHLCRVDTSCRKRQSIRILCHFLKDIYNWPTA